MTIDPLHAYESTRDFALTPEPAEGGQTVADQLSFGVQTHWASSLQHDFRQAGVIGMRGW